ncbi:HK97-gp10 family putative phage morphogenesis protein [Pelagibacterium lacus]|uniref:HK97 gp10 family phage protein n=1 Tax=Pelagibacterium lacus TaxID=2282655 RepID=A0A369W6M9_9HYPH|nr:HK97-gp10 family putative phage morphogenesis protein [Pelagibacterium lacus]RDE10346.1 HK97 gp10 family phage protein [Pelagibacterium lacus]
MARRNHTEGFQRLEKRLANIPKKIRQEMEKALIKSGEETAAAMKALVPVDDGDLRDSIVVTPPGGTTPLHGTGGSRHVPEGAVAVTAGNNGVRYGHLVEFGTRNENYPAQPFFYPGLRMTRTRNQRRIRRALGKAIKDSKNG